MLANLIVGQVTPQLQKEIEAELSGNIRQICVSPQLYLVQIPYQDRPSEPGVFEELDSVLADARNPEDPIEIGIKDGRGYLLVRSTGWMCEYQQHHSDITRTALHSLHEPLQEKKRHARSVGEQDAGPQKVRQGSHWPVERRPDDEEMVRRFDHMTASMLREEEMSAYDRYIWNIAQDPTTFSGNEERRRILQAWITMESYTSPAVREAVAAAESELDELDEEEATERIGDIISGIVGSAEDFIFSLTDNELEPIARFELEHQLHALRAGMLTEKELDIVLSGFGEYKLLEARPDVEQCLIHPNASIRRRALETLVMGMGLFEYAEVAFRFLHDSDPECREQGMRSLNPEGKILEDLRVLTAYARIAADQEETQEIRLCAYYELLMATGYELDHDTWEDIEWFLESGGNLNQASWIDWKLVQFFLEEKSEDCRFNTTLSFHTQGDWMGWEDQYDRVYCTPEGLSQHVLQPAHRIIRTRLPDYQMTITVVSLPSATHSSSEKDE